MHVCSCVFVAVGGDDSGSGVCESQVSQHCYHAMLSNQAADHYAG